MEREIRTDLLVAIYSSVLLEHGAIYCSAPITSGRRFLAWIQSHSDTIHDVDHATAEFPDEHRMHVVEPNLMHARGVVAALRRNILVPVIDPTAVPHIPVWKQNDWLRFWEKIIARFAFGVVLIDDWQFSFGCSHEFAFAASLGLPAFDERGDPLHASDGLLLIDRAIADIEGVGGSSDRLRQARRLLSEASSPEVAAAPSSLEALLFQKTGCISKTRS